MTVAEKTQVKFLTELIGIVLLFGSVFGTFKVNEWRVNRVEGDLKTHCHEHKSIQEELKDLSKKQVQVMTNQAIILKAIEERKGR